jgi:hypothetical protein
MRQILARTLWFNFISSGEKHKTLALTGIPEQKCFEVPANARVYIFFAAGQVRIWQIRSPDADVKLSAESGSCAT